jgi:hypothetical protein
MAKRRIRQEDYDVMVSDFVKQSVPFKEACIDAIETLERSNYDLSVLFLYRTEEELQLKERIENNCKMIEGSIVNTSYTNNLVFSIHGLSSILRGDLQYHTNEIKLLENRKFFHSILLLLKTLASEVIDQDSGDIDGKDDAEDDDGDDEDGEDITGKIAAQVLELLKFISLMFQFQEEFHNRELFFELSIFHSETLLKLLDHYVEDTK